MLIALSGFPRCKHMTRHVPKVMVSMCLYVMEPPPFPHWCVLLAKCVCMVLF